MTGTGCRLGVFRLPLLIDISESLMKFAHGNFELCQLRLKVVRSIKRVERMKHPICTNCMQKNGFFAKSSHACKRRSPTGSLSNRSWRRSSFFHHRNGFEWLHEHAYSPAHAFACRDPCSRACPRSKELFCSVEDTDLTEAWFVHEMKLQSSPRCS